MISPAFNPRVFSRIAKFSGSSRGRLFSAGVALALGVSGAWAQEASNSSKKAAANEAADLALDVFTSFEDPDDSGPAPAQQPQEPAASNSNSWRTPGYFPGFRPGFNGGLAGPSFPSLLHGPAELPFSNGIPIAAVGPAGTPLAAPSLFAGSEAYGPSGFDVMKQPSGFKYTGSEISLLYGASSNGASIRAAGFVTSMATNDVQLFVGATFTDQNGLAFPGGRYSPYGRSKFSAQTQQYFGGLNYKLAGGAMIIGVDFAVADTKLNGNFRPINRPTQSTFAVVNPNNIGNVKSYATQLGLTGQLPGNVGYQVGLGFDQATLSGSDGSDLRSLMGPPRRR